MGSRLALYFLILLSTLACSPISRTQPVSEQPPWRVPPQYDPFGRDSRWVNSIDQSPFLARSTGSSSASEQADSTLVPVGDWLWGQCYTVDVYQDTFAVIGNGQLVHVLNIARLDSPFVVGEYTTGPVVMDIVVRDSLAFVVAGSRLIVLDISDPTEPRLVSTTELSRGTFRMVIEDTLAYITTHYRLIVVDIANPEQPRVRGQAPLIESFMQHAVRKGIVYMGYRLRWITTYPEIIDCRNPDSPRNLGNFDTTGFASSVFVRDTLLFLAGMLDNSADDFIKVFSVSDPLSPTVLSTTVIPDTDSAEPWNLFVRDTLAYLSMYGYTYQGLSVFSVQDPQNVRLVQEVQRPYQQQGNLRTASGDGVVAVAQGTGLRLFRWTLNDSLAEAGFFFTGDRASNIAVRGNYAYVTHAPAGLTILDVSDPIRPRRIAGIELPQRAIFERYTGAYDIALDSTVAFITTTNYISIVSVENPRAPREETFFPIRTPVSIKLQNGYGYVVHGEAGIGSAVLSVLAVSDPLNISIVSRDTLPPGYQVGFLTCLDTLLALTHYADGVRIYSIADPVKPRELSTISGFATGLILNDTLLYIVSPTERGDFWTYCVTNALEPMLIDSIDFGYVDVSWTDMAIAKGFAYFQTYAVDISTPSRPFLAGFASSASYVVGLDAQDRFLYYCDGYGVHVLENTRVMGIRDLRNELPPKLSLFQNYPNPFNAFTRISFTNPLKQHISVRMYDVQGRLVDEVVNEELPAGEYTITWNPRQAASGVYFCRISDGMSTITRKIVMIK